MKRWVVVTAQVLDEFESTALWWSQNRSADAAVCWFDEIFAAIHALSSDAERFAVCRESKRFSSELRQQHFGVGKKATHRIIFTIQDVRHVGRADLAPEDLR